MEDERKFQIIHNECKPKVRSVPRKCKLAYDNIAMYRQETTNKKFSRHDGVPVRKILHVRDAS